MLTCCASFIGRFHSSVTRTKMMNEVVHKCIPLGKHRYTMKSKNIRNLSTNNITELYMASRIGTSTERVFYQDTYQEKLTSKIVDLGKDEEGLFVVFDKSIFHPQGGGQPDDKGYFTISDVVFKVKKLNAPKDPYADPYIIKHYIEGDAENQDLLQINAVGLQVIDMELRAIYARLHSAGHLLANAVGELYPQLEGYHGNHFPGQSFVVFKGTPLPEREIMKTLVLDKMKSLISAKLPVKNSWASTPRTIQFGDLKEYPCGGTHVANSETIGEFSIRNIKNEKGNLKIGYDII
jgi:alanyl-tRNA synthetase